MNAGVLAERQAAALQAIQSLYGTPEGEFGPTLFVSHRLEELEPEYWEANLGVERPSPGQILNALVLVGTWGAERSEIINVFDSRLPGEVSDYLLSVRFEDDGRVQQVSMES